MKKILVCIIDDDDNNNNVSTNLNDIKRNILNIHMV